MKNIRHGQLEAKTHSVQGRGALEIAPILRWDQGIAQKQELLQDRSVDLEFRDSEQASKEMRVFIHNTPSLNPVLLTE